MLLERESCLLVLNSVTSTSHWYARATPWRDSVCVRARGAGATAARRRQRRAERGRQGGITRGSTQWVYSVGLILFLQEQTKDIALTSSSSLGFMHVRQRVTNFSSAQLHACHPDCVNLPPPPQPLYSTGRCAYRPSVTS